MCLSRGKEVAAHNPVIAHCKSAWEFGGIAASPLAASPHAHRSREISAASWLSSSRVAAPSSPPFAGVHAAVRGSPRPAVRGRSRRRPAADSSPPAAADPSPVDPVHTSRPGVTCLCFVVPTGTFYFITESIVAS